MPARALCCFLLAIAAAATLSADDFPEIYNDQEETVKPLSPQEALAALTVPEGFEATLFAAEPDVQNPIAMCTDTRGRLWVAENFTYANSGDNFDLELRDRIVILEDSNGDGRHDSRKVFWNQGQKVTSVAVGFGGVWVTAAPHLLFIPDRNGDDIPDGEPEVMLEGFDGDSVRHNIVNGLKWGPDGWLYGRHGIQATSHVGRPGAADAERVAINCSVWRFHPTRKTFDVVSRGTTNPWGMDWDENGECWLINTVIGHLWHVVPGAYWKRMYGSHDNPHLYELIDQTADHVHWAEGEVWSDAKKGLSQTTDAAGGGHAHCGLLCPDGTWPPEFRSSILAGNLHGRRLNRDVLEREGCSYTAHHAPDLFPSSDPYFRVIEMEHARGGGMYLADWSDIGECHENDGVHRSSGRIFRLKWKGVSQERPRAAPGVKAQQGDREFPVPPLASEAPDLAKLPAAQLVALQRSPSEWLARTARRVLQERAAAGDDLGEAASALRWMIRANESPRTTLRALWSLHAIDALTRPLLVELLHTSDSENVRAWCVKLIAERPYDEANPELLHEVGRSDASGLVRLYVASALPRMRLKDRLYVASSLARHAEDVADRQQPLLIWYGIEAAVVDQPEQALELAAATPMHKLSQFIARRLTHELERRPEGVAKLVELLQKTQPEHNQLRKDLLTGMSEALRGWQRAKAPAAWQALAAKLSESGDEEIVQTARELSVVFGDGRALDELRKIAGDENAEVGSRRAAIQSLVMAREQDVGKLLTGLLNHRDLAGDAVRGLAAVGGPETPQLIARSYGRFRGGAKEEAIVTLVSRPDFAPALLDAVQQGQIPRNDVKPFQLRQMLTYGSDALSARIRELFPELQQLSESKQQRIRELTAALTPEAIGTANVSHGRLLFKESCAKCHKLFGEGGTTAPELTGAQRTNLTYLLENIVDPSATISKNYQMSVVLLDDGRVLNGVVTTTTDRTLTLQTPEEAVTLDRETIEEIRETSLSLMPEGQLDRLSQEDIRDLIGYLMSPTQAPLPTAVSE